MEELITIQSRLAVPKGRRNDFGKYSYRTCEDILNAVKPLLTETGCTLVVSDGIEPAGAKAYIKATATLTNKEGQSVTATGYAREAETLAGMSAPQVTGTSSSYARKRALCGLFVIDDARDADSLELRKTTEKQPKALKQQPQQVDVELVDKFRNFALPAIKQAQTRDDLRKLYNVDYADLQGMPAFVQAFKDRQQEINARQ